MNDPTCFVVPGEVAADLDAYLYRRRKAGETLDGALVRVIREGIRSASIEDELAELASSPLEIPAIEFPDLEVADFDLEIPSFPVRVLQWLEEGLPDLRIKEDMDLRVPVYRHEEEAPKRPRRRKPSNHKARRDYNPRSTRKRKG